MRSVVKHSYLKTTSRGRARAKAHVKYIQFRGGNDKDQGPRKFFNSDEEGLSGRRVVGAIDRQNHRQVVMHKLIVSPGVQGADVQQYTREVLAKLSSHKGLDLEWYGVVHENTKNPHAHVVVMAKDRNGFQVRISKDDYGPIKQAGDEYLIRNRLWEKEPVKEKDKDNSKDKGTNQAEGQAKRSFGQKLISALKAAKSEYGRELTREEERQAKVAHEEESLGKAPTFEQISLAREESERRHKERVWKAYSRPIAVKAGRGGKTSKTVRTYNWTDSLSELRALEAQVRDVPEIRDQLSEVDVARLERWIKDSHAEQAALVRQAEKVEKVEVEVSEEVKFVLSAKSGLDEIRQVQKLNGQGDISLPAHELLAIEKWQEAAAYREPISVEVPGASRPVMYDKEDLLEALKFLASEYEEPGSWAKDSLTKESYRKLKSWIRDKEAERQAAEKTEPKEFRSNELEREQAERKDLREKDGD